MACRQGDWKLIRWFDTSERFPEEYELYNLREDLSETRNLAAQHPDKVREMRALMDRHLKDTHAAAPIPNPAYNPKARPVMGWTPLNSSELQLGAGALVLECKEDRAQMVAALKAPAPGSPLSVRVRMRANDGGDGIVYWATTTEPDIVKERRADFKTGFDGQWKEYEVSFKPANAVTKLRLDLSTKPTRVEIAWIRLCNAGGRVIQEWDFTKPAVAPHAEDTEE